jgi:hypothetical protein
MCINVCFSLLCTSSLRCVVYYVLLQFCPCPPPPRPHNSIACSFGCVMHFQCFICNVVEVCLLIYVWLLAFDVQFCSSDCVSVYIL